MKAGDLAAADELAVLDAAAPFMLTLVSERSGQPVVFECRQVLRLLPGRRLVVRAAVEGGAVILKLFLGSRRARYRAREGRGVQWMAEAGIPVAGILDWVRGEGIDGLVLEYLEHGRPVPPTDQRRLEQVAALLGRMHDAGGFHADLHLENFLAAEGGVHAIDGDGVRRRRRGALPLPAGLDNLAVLAAQRPPAEDGGSAGLLSAYLEARGVESPVGGFPERLEVARRRRLERYAGKTQRNCSEYVVGRSFRRRSFAVRGEGEQALAALGEGLQRAFETGSILKKGNSATVIRVDAAQPIVVKRFNIKNASHAVRRMLRPVPRYRRAWIAGQLLHFLDIPTARPLALVEMRIGPLRGIAYLVMRDVGGRHLLEAMAEEGLDDARCGQVAELFCLLRAAGLCHNDTKATNFLVTDDGVRLIDLDAMRMDSSGWVRDVRRFLENFSGDERRRFEAAFAGAGLI